jgi:hypothetical protein
MWKNGIGVVYREEGSRKWRFVNPPLELRLKKDFLQVKFSFRFERKKSVFFALSFPWTYSDDQEYFQKLEKRVRAKREELYFEKEVGVV